MSGSSDVFSGNQSAPNCLANPIFFTSPPAASVFGLAMPQPFVLSEVNVYWKALKGADPGCLHVLSGWV